MSVKDVVLDFINLGFALVLIIFCILFFISGNNFGAFTAIMESLVPVSFFGILLLVKLKFNRVQLKKRKEEENTDITLKLSFTDKLKSDLFLYSLPILVLIVPFVIDQNVNFANVLQALLVFIVAYLWQRMIFKKEY